MEVELILFDLGGVLLDWSPEQFCDEIIGGQAGKRLATALSRSNGTWARMDRGLIHQSDPSSLAEIANEAQVELKHVERLFEALPQLLQPIPKGLAILENVRRRYRTMVLSNFHRDLFQIVRDRHWFLQDVMFDDMVISAHVQSAKPDPSVYEIVLQRSGLHERPSAILFIDDKEENVQAARDKGMRAILCKDHEKVFEALIREGVCIEATQLWPAQGQGVAHLVTLEQPSRESTTRLRNVFLEDVVYSQSLDAIVKACVDLMIVDASTNMVLLGKRQAFPMKDWWWACGGRMKAGECVESTAIRLLKSELKIDLAKGESLSMDQVEFHNRWKHRFHHIATYSLDWDSRQQPPINNGTADIEIVLAILLSREELTQLQLQPEEYSDFQWITLQHMQQTPSILHPQLASAAAHALHLQHLHHALNRARHSNVPDHELARLLRQLAQTIPPDASALVTKSCSGP